MSINFSYKKHFIRNIIIKENQNYYFFIGKYNIKKTISYLQIKKLKFNKYNYKENYSQKLKDIIEEYDLDENNNVSYNTYFKEKLNAKDSTPKTIKEINSLFGFIKFNMGYYAIFSCDSDIVGKISRNLIYRVDRLIYFKLFDVDDDFQQSNENIIEGKYYTLTTSFGYDKQLYFSYSYDLTKTLQRNYIENFKKEMISNFENTAYTKNYDKNINNKNDYFSKSNCQSTFESPPKNDNLEKNEKILMKKYTNHYFCWNYFHMNEFFDIIKNKAWVNFFIYGFFHQVVCNFKGLCVLISVAARRNRNYAGMRYLKRGIADDGSVANDVETEQILEEISTTWSDCPKISSYIQIRGSIPLYWYQNQRSFYSKPTININLSDIKFEATKRHFASLIKRYGHPCIVCNLTKMNENEGKKQETLLNKWYYNALKYINNSIEPNFGKILYYHYDLKNERNKNDFYKQFYDISCPFISETNIFCFIPKLKNRYTIFLQNGVVRANCIDCLDRTNVFQQILGIAVLVIQLRYLGVNEKFPENEKESIYGVLIEIYVKMGHELSSQYTGSLAIKQGITHNKNIMDKMIDSFNELLIAIKRSVINYFVDQNKQNAMNLFLGKYPINTGLPFIWDLPSDEILHKKKNLKELTKTWYRDKFKKYVVFNLFSDIDYKKKLRNNGKVITIEKSEELISNKNVSETSNNNKREHYKMSTTSLLIFNELYSKTNIINHRDGSQIKRLEDNKILPYCSSSFSATTPNINQYILDYNSYIEYKLKNENKNEEEIAFDDDLIIQFLSEVNNRDIRDFNDFEYYNINFIKKNIMNNNNINLIQKPNQSSKNIYNSNNIVNTNQNYFEDLDLHKLKSSFGYRKSISILKYSTPIKNKIPQSRHILMNGPFKKNKLRDNYNGTYSPYTPFIPQYISLFNQNSPNNNNNFCTNPRNVKELRKEMIKLDVCTFQIKDDDIDKMGEFTLPIEKQLNKKDIYELDPFNNCDLSNTEGIFDIQKKTEEIHEIDPFKTILLEEKKEEEVEYEDDYLIFDLEKNKLKDKKRADVTKKKTNIMNIKDYIPNIGDKEQNEENKNEKKNNEHMKSDLSKKDDKKIKSSEEDNNGKDENLLDNTKYKTLKRVKQYPLKIEDNYFIIK